MHEISAFDLKSAFEAFNQQAETLLESHHRLEAEVQRLNDELAQKNRLLARKERLAALGEMAAGVAHEIRNPLGGIHLYADLLAKEVARSVSPEGSPARGLLEKLTGGIRHLNRIVEDFLLYAREIEIRRSPCRLDLVVEEALSYARPLLESRPVRLERADASPPVTVEADHAMLCRVVLNLVTNGIQAMPAGGCLVVATERATLGRAVIRIADSGCGIPPERIERLFAPFSSHRAGGTGLGLSISHRIVELHGGAIDVESEVGKGSTFVVEIPEGSLADG